MYRNKVTRLSIINLRIVTKVCRASSISWDSAKPSRTFLSNLGTATEKSDFFIDSDGFGRENDGQTPSNWNFQKTPDRFHNANVNATGKTGTFSYGCVENENRDEFKQSPVGQIELAYTQQQEQRFTVHGHNANVNLRPHQGVGSYHIASYPTFNINPTSGVSNRSSGIVVGHNGTVNEGFEHNLGCYSDGNDRPYHSVGNYHFAGQPNVHTHQTNDALNRSHRPGTHFDGLDCQPNVPMHHTSAALNGLHRPGNCFSGNSERYQQDASGTNHLNVGNTGWNPNYLQNATGDPQIHRDKDDGSIKCTIEELDHFCKEGKIEEAIKVLGLLEQHSVSVDLSRYLSLMMLCAENKALEEAKSVHMHLARSGINLGVKTYNKVIELYGKCGSMDDALAVFNQMPRRNITSWDLMITWYGRNGQGEDAIEMFTQFKESGLKPDGKIFLGVLSACGEIGDIIEGMLHFDAMSKDYGIVPSMDHYVSAVKMMGSAGYLDEALEFIERMPTEADVEVWKTLMIFCRFHGYSELGDRCTEIVEILDSSCLDKQSKEGLIPITASDIAKAKRVQKSASQSLLEARSRVHEYRAGDRSCPDHEKLYALLRGLKQQMKEAGYIAEVKFVLHDIDPEGKEEAIMAHSEKLAVARGLISSAARTSIRIIKNLRICGDCHSAMKIISKLVGRELVIRDAKRFHHFRDGLCSCNDYW
ncbi:unnamed protein product [Cuscuta campestris]|uniref:DYW domain-containing protein n=1 Tax=Cuscuta campestris TaxID=132261 RepID=A0A484MHV9_9ASTE|nr:unnamed protein product [Cuscuta campestris]